MKAGYEVSLIGRKLPDSPPMPPRLYKWVRMRLLFKKGPLFYAEYNFRLFWRLLFSRADLLLSNDLDTLLPNFLISRLRRIRLVYDSHEYFTETPELVNRPRVQKVWKTIERFVLSRLDWMITVNESIAQLFEKAYGLKVYVVRNVPVYREALNGLSREELGLPKVRKLLVLQGSGINIQRGAEELIEAMTFLPEAYLMIIGGGDVIPLLKEKVKQNKLDDRIDFYPRMAYERMMAYTAQADLGLTLDKNTNLNYRFSLPNKLFDYIQARTPVLATPLPEIKKIVETYKIGAFVEEMQAESLANDIRKALQSTEIKDSWKKNLSFAAQELCWENEENVLLNLYEQYN